MSLYQVLHTSLFSSIIYRNNTVRFQLEMLNMRNSLIGQWNFDSNLEIIVTQFHCVVYSGHPNVTLGLFVIRRHRNEKKVSDNVSCVKNIKKWKLFIVLYVVRKD